MKDRKFHILIATISGLLMLIAILETIAFHEDVSEVTVTESREPALTRYSLDLFIDIYRVGLSYDWRSPTAHGTSRGVGSQMKQIEKASARIGTISGLIVKSTVGGNTRYLVFELSFILALLSYLVYLVPPLRGPRVLMVATVIQAYTGLWLGLACLHPILT